jgi:hypothetical protein
MVEDAEQAFREANGVSSSPPDALQRPQPAAQPPQAKSTLTATEGDSSNQLLPQVLAELAATLEPLACAVSKLVETLERKAEPPVERLAYRLDELADAIGVSRRSLDRERAAGRFPAPDRVVGGKIPIWSRATVLTAYLRRHPAPASHDKPVDVTASRRSPQPPDT